MWTLGGYPLFQISMTPIAIIIADIILNRFPYGYAFIFHLLFFFNFALMRQF